jgi:hypothetical protein
MQSSQQVRQRHLGSVVRGLGAVGHRLLRNLQWQSPQTLKVPNCHRFAWAIAGDLKAVAGNVSLAVSDKAFVPAFVPIGP